MVVLYHCALPLVLYHCALGAVPYRSSPGADARVSCLSRPEPGPRDVQSVTCGALCNTVKTCTSPFTTFGDEVNFAREDGRGARSSSF